MQTQREYILEYVARIDGLLEASLSREVLADNDKVCRHCDKGLWAIWRCRDCSLGVPLCRRCIRDTHRENPLHRIENWNGKFFRPAELWEVGTHILVRHHTGVPLCDNLVIQDQFLEAAEKGKDIAEQESMHMPYESVSPSINHSSAPARPSTRESVDDIYMSKSGVHDDLRDDQFMQYLDELRENGKKKCNEAETQDDWEMEDEIEEDATEVDFPTLNQYLPQEFNAGTRTSTGTTGSSAGSVMGTYIRVVHTNGIHNIAMISCECRGHDVLPCDLLAARLLPASFERIRTLFTAQLLDLFRLCNLELKASAYQFYHLLQRLTCPIAPAEVVNLYREFRRMSRLWRWMKRLKWAGYGGNGRNVSNVTEGQLSVFCPACPQPGINVPDNWKDDPARYALG